MSVKNKISGIYNGITINDSAVITLVVDGYAFYREYNDSTVEATCQGQGYTQHTAKDGRNTTFNTVDGETMPYSYQDNYKAQRSHNYNYFRKWKNNKEATCQRSGIKIMECQWCTEQIEVNVNSVAHEYVTKNWGTEHAWGDNPHTGECYEEGFRCPVCKAETGKQVKYVVNGDVKSGSRGTGHTHTACKWCKTVKPGTS